MLSQKSLSLLHQIILDDSQTFRKISETFNNNFKNENRIKAGTTLIFLLRDNLLNIHQRIISYYILYEISKNQKLVSNQYISIILEMLKKSQNKNEQVFLEDFLNNQIDYLDLTVQNYLKDNTKELKTNLNQLLLQWEKDYKEALNEKNIDLKANDEIRPVIYDRSENDIKKLDKINNIDLLSENDEEKIEKEINFNYFTSNYMSYYPYNNSYFINSEPIWLIPQLSHNFIWDKDSGIKDK